MRTLPTAITTGLSSNLRIFWLVKIQGSTTTYYWTTTSKNNAGNAFTLKETSGGANVTFDSGMIAQFIDQEQQDGIGVMEYTADIRMGGGMAAASDVSIDVLNQGRFDSTILTGPNRFEYRPVNIYLGFVPTGATPNVVIADDLLPLWTGIVEEVLDFDYGHFLLRCVDGSFLRHKPIPSSVVDVTTYPYAPEEVLGMAIPIVYGDFYPINNATLLNNIFYENNAPIPSVLVDEPAKQFIFSSHQLHTFATAAFDLSQTEATYIYDGSLNVYAPITSGATISNTSSGATIAFDSTHVPVRATIIYQPKGKGADTSAAITDHQKCSDVSSSNNTGMDNSTKTSLYLRPTKSPSKAVDSATAATVITFYVDLGTVDSGFTGTLKYKKDGGAATGTTTFTNTDSNTRVALASHSISDSPSELINYQVGITASGSNTAQIKNIAISVGGVLISQITEQREEPAELDIEVLDVEGFMAFNPFFTGKKRKFKGPRPKAVALD